MEDFKAMIDGTLSIFKIEFTVFGYSLSLWNVFLFSAAASILAYMIWRFFDD